jgi:hypothetical protein
VEVAGPCAGPPQGLCSVTGRKRSEGKRWHSCQKYNSILLFLLPRNELALKDLPRHSNEGQLAYKS